MYTFVPVFSLSHSVPISGLGRGTLAPPGFGDPCQRARHCRLTFGPSRRQWWWTSGGRRPMSTYNHILVALALDQTGRTVLKRACALAKLFGARLSVLHVVEYIHIEIGELLKPAPDNPTHQLEQQSRQNRK